MKYPGKSGSFKLGPWPNGINNVKDLARLEQDELSDAENFVFDKEGQGQTRAGYVKKLSLFNAYGLYKITATDGIFFDSGNLVRFNSETWETTILASGFSTGLRASYARIGPRLYFTNGREHGRLDVATSEVFAGFGTPTPGLNLSLAQLGYGNLAAGTYIIGITYVDGSGEESACPGLNFITLEEESGINVSWAGTVPANVEEIRIYMTGAGGKRDELQRVYVADRNDTSAQLTSNEFGSPLTTLFKDEIPVPELITEYNGHLFFSIEKRVFHSETMQYGLYHEDHNEVGSYPSDVSVLEEGLDGLWVVANKTYAYVGAGPKDFTLHDDMFTYPAVKYSGKHIEANLFGLEGYGNRHVPYWFSSRGAVIGLEGGKVLPLMKGKAEPDKFGVGASGTVEFNGIHSVITALDDFRGPGDSVSLQDTFSVQVVNRGISI